jgi:RNA polymerase sigma-70 factor (ECF subfamily)
MRPSPSDADDLQKAGEAADETTLARIAQGESSAMGELYDRHARAVYSLTYRILTQQSDAEDVTQEVFSQAWRQAGRYERERASVGGWLLMIARARAIDRLRARRARPESVSGTDAARFSDLPDVRPNQEKLAISAEQASRVRVALAALPESQRAAIELAYYSGFTQAEIASRLQEPLGTVKTRIRTGLQTLRAALDQA